MPTEQEILQGEFFEIPKEVSIGDDLTEEEPTMHDTQTENESLSSATDQSLEGLSNFESVTGSNAASHRRGLKDLSIPKLYYSISEVSRITGLEQYVLRYWETEFEELSPQKNRAGNRIYSNKDITFILKIKELLREKRYTIEGAKQILKVDLTVERPGEKEATATDARSGMSNIAVGSITHEEIQELKKAVVTLREIFAANN